MPVAEQSRVALTFKSSAIRKKAGAKRRYLEGIASGPSVDAHGERMSRAAIRGMQEQARSGEVLLYADVHGIRASEDIGRVTQAKITPAGEWWIRVRLYDEADPVDDAAKQRADKVWRQINGLEPYERPQKRGFSIEGYSTDQNGGTINGVDLDGVVLVSRPAYQRSVAQAVEKGRGRFKAKRERDNAIQALFDMQREFEDTLRELLEDVDDDRQAEKAIKDLYAEFADEAAPLWLRRYGRAPQNTELPVEKPGAKRTGKARKRRLSSAGVEKAAQGILEALEKDLPASDEQRRVAKAKRIIRGGT